MYAECTPAVTPSVNAPTTFGCSGSSSVATTSPFLRSSAPSRVITMTLPSSDVITSLITRAFTITESTIVGFDGSFTSSTYTRSPPRCVPRYATLPLGCTQTSDVGNVVRTIEPTTFAGRRTSRGVNVTVVCAERGPTIALTVYVPGSYPTNAPSGSICPWPGPNCHVGDSPSISFPAAFFTESLNLSTSPVRPRGVAGVIVTDPTSAGSTSTGNVPRTLPLDAVIVAVPGLSAEMVPSDPTRASVRAQLLQLT